MRPKSRARRRKKRKKGAKKRAKRRREVEQNAQNSENDKTGMHRNKRATNTVARLCEEESRLWPLP